MKDRFGRNIDYIRISVTDRCNLRCIYCMPEEGIVSVPHDDILRYDEIIRIARILAEIGIKKIKLTGGEPLVRKGLPSLVAKLKSIDGIEQVTLTTNGILLNEQIEDLANAGIDAINISLDTLDEEEFRRITRVGSVSTVLEAVELCERYPDIRFKINCVPLKSDEAKQWLSVASLAEKYPIDVRFIEMMPIGLGREFRGVSGDEIKRELEDKYGEAVRLKGSYGNGPSVYYHYPGLKGRIGFISAISHKFCDFCNRIRLTSEGQLKQCLQFADGADLRELIRGGADDDELRHVIEETLYNKPKGHLFEDAGQGVLENRKMSEIGG